MSKEMRGDRDVEGRECLHCGLVVNRMAKAHLTKEFFHWKFHYEIINLTMSDKFGQNPVINHWLKKNKKTNTAN